MPFRFETANERWNFFKKSIIYDAPGYFAIPDKPDQPWPLTHQDQEDESEDYDIGGQAKPKTPFGRGDKDQRGHWRRRNDAENIMNQNHENWQQIYNKFRGLKNEQEEIVNYLQRFPEGSIDPVVREELKNRLKDIEEALVPVNQELEEDENSMKWSPNQTGFDSVKDNPYFEWIPETNSEKSWKKYRNKQYRPVEGKRNHGI